MGRPAPEPPDRAPLRRRLRRQERALLRHRLQRRPLHRRIQGRERLSPDAEQNACQHPTCRSRPMRKNMRIIGHTDQDGRADGQQIMVRTATPISAISARAASPSSTCAIRRSRRPSTTSRTRQTPGACICRCTTICCCRSMARDMFSQPEMADERNYYKPKAGRARRARQGAKSANWSAGMAVYDISKPDGAAPDRLHAGRGHRPAPHLVHRRALGLRLGDDRRLLRLHPRHHRHAGSDEAEDRRTILAAGHEPRRWRGGRTGRCRAGATACITPSSTTTSPIAPGATAASSSSTSRTRRSQNSSSTRTGRRPLAAARTIACRCRTAISSSCSTRRCSTRWRTASSRSGCSTTR